MKAEDMACIIRAKAAILSYEARRWPGTAPVTTAWLKLAAVWGRRHGMTELVREIENQAARLVQNGCPGCLPKVREAEVLRVQ